MSRVPFLCANVTRHFRSHDRLVYNVTLSQTSGSNLYPARLQPGASRSSSPDHERSWSMTRPNREKHHMTVSSTTLHRRWRLPQEGKPCAHPLPRSRPDTCQSSPVPGERAHDVREPGLVARFSDVGCESHVNSTCAKGRIVPE